MSEQSSHSKDTSGKRAEQDACNSSDSVKHTGVIGDARNQEIHQLAHTESHKDDKTLSRPEMIAIEQGETMAAYKARVDAIRSNPLQIEGELSENDKGARFKSKIERIDLVKAHIDDRSPSHLNLKAISETDSALDPVLKLRDYILTLPQGAERDTLEKFARQQEKELLTPEIKELRLSVPGDNGTESVIASNIVSDSTAHVEPPSDTPSPEELVAFDLKQTLRNTGDTVLEKAGFFVHRGREDNFIDYKACQKAWQIAGLEEFRLPKNIIGAIMRNEQHFYKKTDEDQDTQVKTKGTVYASNGKEDSGASIGPAQMQIELIRHLINLKQPNGKAKYEFLAPLQYDSIRAALRPENAALLVGAYLREIEIDQKRHGITNTSAEKIIYGYNDDVNSFLDHGSRHFIPVLNSADVAREKFMHRDLKREKYPSDDRILEASGHVRNVMAHLNYVNEICP